ncbi:MAG: 16S rRNA (uracil(1498)-N(3))-methyltransferase [Ruminococcaceae bacterium]|nr:16S rRNA (uracil(1498)-N(3))-methyltransferase [Oscillospiraceae bacterium]
MHRFYTDKIDCENNKACIVGDDVKHIKKVLRLNSGDEVVVCDYKNKDYICKISAFLENEVQLDIIEIKDNFSEPPIDVTIYQSLPKSDKMELIIQKCVEIGVKKFVPVASKRSVVKLNDDKKKIIRWQRIADEAAKQCGRGIKVEVNDVLSFKEAIKSVDDDTLKLIPYENEKELSIKTVLKESKHKKIAVFIGPEGGFSDEEIDFALANGFSAVTLGPRILRCETAPIAVATVCMYEKGDW